MMIMLILSAVLIVLGIVGIITFRKVHLENKKVHNQAPYQAVRNFWIAYILGISLLITLFIGLCSGILEAMPYMNIADKDGNYFNIIALIVNALLGIGSLAYIVLTIIKSIVSVIAYIQVILIAYNSYCIKHRVYVNKFYKYYLLVNSIISLLTVIITFIVSSTIF